MKQYLECGQAVNTHGLKGELRAVPWGDSPQSLAELKRVFIGGVEYKIESARIHGNLVILKFEGINDINAAIRLKSKVLFAAREDITLDEDEFFVQDAIGLPVYDESGNPLGELTDILNLPAADVFVVRAPDGAERLIPNVPEFVKLVDIHAERIVAAPINGM